MVKYQIKKIAEIQTFQRFLFCPFSSKNGTPKNGYSL
jgi:hypothetical protein